MKTALIFGITGQDGAYLSRLLLGRGYRVFGASRRVSADDDRLRDLGVADDVTLVPADLCEPDEVREAIASVRPDEIYNLAALSSVTASFEEPLLTAEVTGLGALRILEAIRATHPSVRFYQASSSEMFGRARVRPQAETTPFHPKSPYALAKLFAHGCAVTYRESYGLFACSGILFNHESPLRRPEFVTRKISQAVARIGSGLQEDLVLGNLDSSRDWGYAPEYVEAMWMMLQQPEPDDFVIATGEVHTVREFASVAFGVIGVDLDWVGSGVDEVGTDRRTGAVRVRVDPVLLRAADPECLVGDSAKARRLLGWAPRTGFEDLVRLMVADDLERIGPA